MKHYDTHFDDYVQSAEKCPLHPELNSILAGFPTDFANLGQGSSITTTNTESEVFGQGSSNPTTNTESEVFGNLIVYGPSGVGKYTQVLRILKRYSPSQLKYDKKVTLSIKKQSKKMTTSVPISTNISKKPVSNTNKDAATSKKPMMAASTASEKQCFSMTYRISDIHFEIDMSLLGCNSKQVWHELYLQIVDIVAIRPIKRGVIVCKNFHAIHSELLENFYSYVQSQELFRCGGGGGELVYVLITEHLSFIPNQLMDRFAVLSVGRPTQEAMISAVAMHRGDTYAAAAGNIIADIGDNENILNMKELFSFGLVPSADALPRDNFNIICDSLIAEMESMADVQIDDDVKIPERSSLGHVIYFRDALYDILIYGLDAMECVWYVSRHYMDQQRIPVQNIPGLMAKIHEFSHQYGNNYRAIFHLEFVFLHILQCVKSI
jgi:hypothetical protein